MEDPIPFHLHLSHPLDIYGYEDIIRKAFPKGLLIFTDNFDDMHSGWDIAPAPGELIEFKFNTGNQLSIIITAVSTWINIGCNVVTKTKILFSGDIPPTPDTYEPDTDFIYKLLLHYKKIG